LTKFSVR